MFRSKNKKSREQQHDVDSSQNDVHYRIDEAVLSEMSRMNGNNPAPPSGFRNSVTSMASSPAAPQNSSPYDHLISPLLNNPLTSVVNSKKARKAWKRYVKAKREARVVRKSAEHVQKIVQELTDDLPFLVSTPNQPIAKFHRSEVVVGNLLGRGDFARVYEVKDFDLHDDTEAEEQSHSAVAAGVGLGLSSSLHEIQESELERQQEHAGGGDSSIQPQIFTIEERPVGIEQRPRHRNRMPDSEDDNSDSSEESGESDTGTSSTAPASAQSTTPPMPAFQTEATSALAPIFNPRSSSSSSQGGRRVPAPFARTSTAEYQQRLANVSRHHIEQSILRLRARDVIRSGEKKYTLKHLTKSLLRNPREFHLAAAALLIEAKYLSKLKHPNIIKVTGLAMSGGGINAMEASMRATGGKRPSFLLGMGTSSQRNIHALRMGNQSCTTNNSSSVVIDHTRRNSGGDSEGIESGQYDSYFLVSERLTDTLDRRIRQWRRDQPANKKLSEQSSEQKIHTWKQMMRKTSYALQISNALVYLHERKLLFRDLKPQNIGFIGDNQTIALFNFGLCREVNPDTGKVYEDEVTELFGAHSWRYTAVECFPQPVLFTPADLLATTTKIISHVSTHAIPVEQLHLSGALLADIGRDIAGTATNIGRDIAGTATNIGRDIAGTAGHIGRDIAGTASSFSTTFQLKKSRSKVNLNDALNENEKQIEDEKSNDNESKSNDSESKVKSQPNKKPIRKKRSSSGSLSHEKGALQQHEATSVEEAAKALMDEKGKIKEGFVRLVKPPYGIPVDVYSWAMVYYEMLTLNQPFSGMTQKEHFRKVAGKKGGQRPGVYQFDLTPSIISLLQRAWDQDPNKRPTMESVSRNLQLILRELEALIKDEQKAIVKNRGGTSNTLEQASKKAHEKLSRRAQKKAQRDRERLEKQLRIAGENARHVQDRTVKQSKSILDGWFSRNKYRSGDVHESIMAPPPGVPESSSGTGIDNNRSGSPLRSQGSGLASSGDDDSEVDLAALEYEVWSDDDSDHSSSASSGSSDEQRSSSLTNVVVETAVGGEVSAAASNDLDDIPESDNEGERNDVVGDAIVAMKRGKQRDVSKSGLASSSTIAESTTAAAPPRGLSRKSSMSNLRRKTKNRSMKTRRNILDTFSMKRRSTSRMSRRTMRLSRASVLLMRRDVRIFAIIASIVLTILCCGAGIIWYRKRQARWLNIDLDELREHNDEMKARNILREAMMEHCRHEAPVEHDPVMPMLFQGGALSPVDLECMVRLEPIFEVKIAKVVGVTPTSTNPKECGFLKLQQFEKPPPKPKHSKWRRKKTWKFFRTKEVNSKTDNSDDSPTDSSQNNVEIDDGDHPMVQMDSSVKSINHDHIFEGAAETEDNAGGDTAELEEAATGPASNHLTMSPESEQQVNDAMRLKMAEILNGMLEE